MLAKLLALLPLLLCSADFTTVATDPSRTTRQQSIDNRETSDAITTNIPAENNLTLYERSNSIPDEIIGRRVGWPVPWPRIGELTHEVAEDFHKLPEQDSNLRWLRYCFINEESMRIIYDLWIEAVARWQPAMEVSSLRIVPDITCNGNYKCLCEFKAKDGREEVSDALHISAFVPDDAKSEFGKTSIAYNQEGLENYLCFEYRTTGRHAIGLFHEHQRFDAVTGDWIYFECRALNLYAEVEAQVRKDTAEGKHWSFPESMTVDERMEHICCNSRLAKSYRWGWPTDYMPVGYRVDPETGHKNRQWSQEYDYKSIMGYDSMIARGGLAPLLKNSKRVGKGEVNFIHQGGTRWYAKKSISMGDIRRVYELYPLDPESAEGRAAARTLQRWIIAKEFQPVVYDVQDKQEEVVAILKKTAAFADIEPEPLKPFRTTVFPAPTDAFDAALFAPYHRKDSFCTATPPKPNAKEDYTVTDLESALELTRLGPEGDNPAGEGPSKPTKAHLPQGQDKKGADKHAA